MTSIPTHHRGTLLTVGNRLVPIDDTGLVGLWTMGEGSGATLYDRSGNGNDGTIMGATWTWDSTRKKYDLSFDGVDDYVEVLDSPSLDITNAITVMGWTYIFAWGDSRATPGWPRLVSKRDAFDLWFSDPSLGNARFIVYSGGTQYGNTTPIAVPLNTWIFWAGTAEKNGRVKLYKDGVVVADAPGPTANFDTNTYNLRIGSNWEGRKLNGLIDEVAIYNRALSVSEISKLYEKTRP